MGVALGISGAGTYSHRRTSHTLAGRIRGAVSRCLRQLRQRFRSVPATEIRHFSLRYDARGAWTLNGARCQTSIRFRDLAAALSFARDDADAGEADIELWVEGLYIFVRQTRGWPQRLCAPAPTASAHHRKFTAFTYGIFIDGQQDRARNFIGARPFIGRLETDL